MEEGPKEKTLCEWCRRATEGWWGVQEDQGQPRGMELDAAALHNMHLSRLGHPYTLRICCRANWACGKA